MSPADSQAAISSQTVRDALQSLVFLTVPARPSPLLHLCLVETYLQQNRFPITLESRRFALQKILLDLIVDRFTTLCAVFRLDPPTPNAPYDEAIRAIRRYAQPANPELTGWCWLYYRFVRVELAIPPEQFSELCCVDARSLRRYLGHVIQRLTGLLMEAEWAVNQDWHGERLDAWRKTLGPAVEHVPFIVIVDTWERAGLGS